MPSATRAQTGRLSVEDDARDSDREGANGEEDEIPSLALWRKTIRGASLLMSFLAPHVRKPIAPGAGLLL